MYQFSSATDRIMRIRQRIRDRVIQQDAERAEIATEAYKQYQHIVPIIRRPLITLEVCKKMTCRVDEDELIVGNRGKHFLGNGADPQWMRGGFAPYMVDAGIWTLREDGLYHSPDDEELKCCVAPEDVEKMREINQFWEDKTMSLMADAWQPDGAKEFMDLGCSDYGEGGMGLMVIPVGHLTPGFEKIINVGYDAIRRQAQDFLDAHEGNLMGENVNKYMFYKSATIVCDAASIMITRYGDACKAAAEAEHDPRRRQELETMADGLYNLAHNPARNYWEALQGTIMYQLFLAIAGGYPAPAFGRFDQYTWPFLKRDLEKGMDMAWAQELTDAFFLKSNCFYGGGAGRLAQTTGIGNTYQHTTIGGVDRDTGEDATNPVTYMVLETVGRLLLHDPTISLRINKNTPDRLWDCAIETSKLVGGLPLFQNDDVIIPGLIKELGFELRDARDYSIIGCQEIVGSGNDYPAPNGVHAPHASIHYGVVFDMAINNGINPYNGRQAKVHTGYLYEMNSIEEVREAVRKMTDYCLKWYVTLNNYTEYMSPFLCPHADLSISMEGCMESGKDCVDGGCKYNSYGGTATGLATLADSLTTIKYMCFDKKKCTTRELYDAVMANWEGYEDLRQTIINEVPHYGNGDDYADVEMKWMCDLYYELCQECYSVRSKVYKSGLYGASDHVAQGYHTWATPDGRKAGEPIADAASPSQGKDHNGPTAVFNSSLCHDHTRYMDGMALNLRIHPSAVNSEDAKGALRDMTKTYFERGGMEVQYNIVSSQTMRAAQADPTTYRDLVVRIAGYSAYFVELNLDCQNDLIARTENSIG